MTRQGGGRYYQGGVGAVFQAFAGAVERFGGTVPVVGRDAVLPGQGGESYGVALSVGQYGDARLNGESPIGGLFCVGCDAGGFGLGTHQAVDSAVNVSRLVRAYHQTLGQSGTEHR